MTSMLDRESIIQETANFVRKEQEGESSGHDWWHTYRVWKLAEQISKSESADSFIVQLAALLHDIADHKFNNGDLKAGRSIITDHLSTLGINQDSIEFINDIVENISFKGANVEESALSIEGKIVQDADRLDAIGAVGIARAFAYGGFSNRVIYNPDIKPEIHSDFQSYRSNTAPSINHFYEKLLLLKDRMHTTSAKKIAEERHRFMEQYLNQFFNEWEGN